MLVVRAILAPSASTCTVNSDPIGCAALHHERPLKGSRAGDKPMLANGCYGPKHKKPAAWISKQVCRIAASPLRTVAVIGRSHGPNEQSERHKYVTGPVGTLAGRPICQLEDIAINRSELYSIEMRSHERPTKIQRYSRYLDADQDY